MELNCNQLVSVETYIDELKTANLAVWTAIADDPNVKNALFAVAEMGYKNSSAFHHATSYLLNCISNAYLEATQSQPADATESQPAEATDSEPAQATEAEPAERSAIVFSTAPNNYVPGDYLGARIKPDLTAFAGDMSMLATALKASAEAPFGKLAHFHVIVSFGEWKLGLAELGQFLWYLAALKRYRPDLPAVHGLYLEAGKRLMLITLNACGSWSSAPVEIGFEHRIVSSSVPGNTIKFQKIVPSTDTWIAYVVALYTTRTARDFRFSLADPAAGTALWNVKLPDFAPLTVRPFHATHCPGRMTWASFVLDLPSSEAASESTTPQSTLTSSSPSRSSSSTPQSALARGFLKTSWQDSSSIFTETYNLAEAHQREWLPGLVRHWTASIGTQRINLHVESADRVSRRKELVYLASLGQPLSQCTSASHLLRVIYDATEIHARLLGKDILHGDMSWFNILCNPWHDDKTLTVKPAASGPITCIDYILTDDKKRQPCALVLDLDHSALMQVLYSRTYPRRQEKTGTPMFVSVELSSKTALPSGNVNGLVSIVDRLAILDREEYSELRKRAFPNGDYDFMKRLHGVIAKEQERHAQGAKPFTDPKSLHRPQHDVESLYWILLWALSRACPVGMSPHGTPGDALSQFVDIMLEHRLGHDESRSEKLFGNGPAADLLHPLLRKDFHPVLEALAIYLSVPWHRYLRDVHPTHAHVAIRRILLPLIYRIMKRKVNDVFFDTAQPRTVLFRRSFQDRKCPTGPGTPSLLESSNRPISSNSRCRKGHAEGPPSQQASLPSDQSVVVAESSAPADQSSAPADQSSAPADQSSAPADQSSAPADQPSAPAVQLLAYGQRGPDFDPFEMLPDDYYGPESDSESPKKRAADDDSDDDEPESKRAKIEIDETEPDRDVETLIKMFWADRNLWFGTGFHNEADMDAALAAALKGGAL